jgi:hypothetical protein
MVVGGYTYFDPKLGHEFSAVTSFTYNLINPHTDYQNGVDWYILLDEFGVLEISRFVNRDVPCEVHQADGGVLQHVMIWHANDHQSTYLAFLPGFATALRRFSTLCRSFFVFW